MPWWIRFPKSSFVAVVALFAAGPAMADGANFWRETPGFAPIDAAPAFVSADALTAHAQVPQSDLNVAFSDVAGATRPDADAISAAIRADTERLATASDLAAASSERGSDRIGGRVVDAFGRFAAVDGAGGYASREYAMREPRGAATFAKIDPKSWTPAAPASLVAYDLPRD